jgi:oligoendopeptidase F
MSDSYEDFLKRAYSEGWRDPIQVTNLEIKAYSAGMHTERKRVLLIFKDISDGRPMRAIDLGHYLERIKKIKE